MLENGGSNDYLRNRNGLSFGIRKTFMTTEGIEGVIMVPETNVEAKGTHQQVLLTRE